jgi:transposase
VCPFDLLPNLNEHRSQIVALWYEEQRLRTDHERLLAEKQTLHQDKARLLAEVQRLERALAAAQAKGKGAKKNTSERRGRPGSTAGAGTTPSSDTPTKEPPPGHGPTEQPHLEHAPKDFDLDEADKVCTQCGGALDEWEGQAEESELIDLLERRFVRRTIRQKKYRCRCGGCIVTAPGPEKLIAGGRYSLAFAIEVAYDKYLLHSPLERQAREMTRQGLVIDSQTLWDQSYALGCVLRPVAEAIHRYVLSFGWVAADETTWWMMRHRHSPPTQKVGEWYVWIAHRPDAAFYLLKPTRDVKAARELLSWPARGPEGQALVDAHGHPKRETYEGQVLCDGWWAYKSVARHVPNVVLAHCWSHVRREVLACEVAFPKETAELIGLIAELYAIEDYAPAGPEGDARRKELRQTCSADVLERIVGWVFQNALKVPAESTLRKAVGYLVNHWVGLTRFLQDPTLPLDNNGVEKDCRQAVQGKKNHYGSRSLRGAETASILYTVVQTAKLSGIEPKTYMRLAALRALRDQSVLLPHAVTAPHLRKELGVSEAEAERALARRRRDPNASEAPAITPAASNHEPAARSP